MCMRRGPPCVCSALQGFAVTKQILKNMTDFNFDAVMHVGDIAYAGIVRRSVCCLRLPRHWSSVNNCVVGCAQATNIPLLNITSDDEWEFVWDIWAEQVAPIAAAKPYMTGVGNHEVRTARCAQV